GVFRSEWINLSLIRHEKDIDGAGGDEHRTIVVKRPRIPRKVLARAKLRRVHEDRHDDAIGNPPRQPREAEVPIVQIPHRRNERNGLMGGTPRGHLLAYAVRRRYGLQASVPKP